MIKTTPSPLSRLPDHDASPNGIPCRHLPFCSSLPPVASTHFAAPVFKRVDFFLLLTLSLPAVPAADDAATAAVYDAAAATAANDDDAATATNAADEPAATATIYDANAAAANDDAAAAARHAEDARDAKRHAATANAKRSRSRKEGAC